MNIGEALYAACLAEPDEDTPRLAYADWLDEHDENAQRAELIRVQCGIIACKHCKRYDCAEIVARERELLAIAKAWETLPCQRCGGSSCDAVTRSGATCPVCGGTGDLLKLPMTLLSDPPQQARRTVHWIRGFSVLECASGDTMVSGKPTLWAVHVAKWAVYFRITDSSDPELGMRIAAEARKVKNHNV